MQFEHTQYSLEEYTLFELLPFNSKFLHYNSETKDISEVLVVVYAMQMVNKVLLLQHLHRIKNIHHDLLGMTQKIIDCTNLITETPQLTKEQVIAVIMEQSQQSTFSHYYQALVSIGPFNQKLSISLMLTILEFVKIMTDKGFPNCFKDQYLYIDSYSWKLRIDGYGDWKYFKVSQGTMGDLSQLGKVIFTFFNKFPPYQVVNDKFYSLIQKRNFQKFWEITQRKQQTPKHIMNMINQLWSNHSIAEIYQNQFIRQSKTLTRQQFKEQCHQMVLKKEKEKLQLEKKRKDKKQKYQATSNTFNNIVQNRTKLNRGIQNQASSIFLDRLNSQENSPRNIPITQVPLSYGLIEAQSNSINILFATLLTIIELNKNNHKMLLNSLVDHKSYLEFKVEGESEQGYQIQVQAKVEVIKTKQKSLVGINCIKGKYMQKIWVQNYLNLLFNQI